MIIVLFYFSIVLFSLSVECREGVESQYKVRGLLHHFLRLFKELLHSRITLSQFLDSQRSSFVVG